MKKSFRLDCLLFLAAIFALMPVFWVLMLPAPAFADTRNPQVQDKTKQTPRIEVTGSGSISMPRTPSSAGDAAAPGDGPASDDASNPLEQEEPEQAPRAKVTGTGSLNVPQAPSSAQDTASPDTPGESAQPAAPQETTQPAAPKPSPPPGSIAVPTQRPAKTPPPPPLFPPVEKREIKDKPAKYGVYLYRDEKFLRLPQAPVEYSGVWFGISLSSLLLAASFVPENELGEMPRYQEGDLIAVHYKGADRATWYYYPLTYFPLIDFPGNNEAELWRRPPGYYLGFSAIGHPQNLFHLFSRAYEDGYRFDQQRIKDDDVVYSDSSIVFARMRHIPDLPISRFLLTNKSVGFDEPSDFNRLLAQLPEEGVLFDMEPARQMDNFEGRRDYLERYNRDTAVRHLITAKEFTLEPGKIVDTGIYIMDPCFVRFMSDNDFGLVLRQGDWQENRGWMPSDIEFGKQANPIPLTDFASHVVAQRHFALRYLARSPYTQVRLMGLRRSTKVTVVYSPIYAYDIAYHEFVRMGYEHFEAHRYDQAIEAYEKALEMQPEYPHALNNLAWLYATATNPDFFDPKKALELALKAGRFRPVKPFILDTISKAFFLNGDLDRAIELEEMAYGDSPAYSDHYNERMALYNNVKQHMDKARAAEKAKDWEEAIKQLHFAVEKLPNYFMGLNRLAWLYATVPDKDLRDGHLALDYSRSALAFASDRAIIWDTMAEAFASIDEAEKALECASRARHFEPMDPYFQDRYEQFKKAAE